MRRFLAILLPLLILFSLTCCQTTTDPFSEYWTSGNNSKKPSASSAEPSSESEESVSPSRDDSVIEISWPDDSSVEEPSPEPSEQASSEDGPSAQESSKQETSKTETSKNTSRSETSRNTSRSETSRTTSGTTSSTTSSATSGTTSSTTSGTTSGSTSSAASQTNSGTSSADPGSDDISGDNSENGGEESGDRPLFTKYVYLKNIAMVWFPENWSYTQGGEYVLDASNSSKSQFITATYASLGGTGLTESILREAAYEELNEQYPVSKGYTVSKTSVTLNDGKHPAITIIKSNGSEPVRQQIYLLKNGNVLTITFFANRSSDIQTLWSFVEIG